MATKVSVLLTPAFVGLVQPLLAFAQTQQPTGSEPLWNCPGAWHMWAGVWGFWWIFPVIMLSLIVLAMFFIGRRSGGMVPHHWGPSRPWTDPTYSALQILNERLAKGELQKQEYEEKKLAILSSGQH